MDICAVYRGGQIHQNPNKKIGSLTINNKARAPGPPPTLAEMRSLSSKSSPLCFGIGILKPRSCVFPAGVNPDDHDEFEHILAAPGEKPRARTGVATVDGVPGCTSRPPSPPPLSSSKVGACTKGPEPAASPPPLFVSAMSKKGQKCDLKLDYGLKEPRKNKPCWEQVRLGMTAAYRSRHVCTMNRG